MTGIAGYKPFDGRNHSGETALHIRSPASVETAVADLGLKWIGLPSF
jgi:hypothetical protein